LLLTCLATTAKDARDVESVREGRNYLKGGRRGLEHGRRKKPKKTKRDCDDEDVRRWD
jgi:hypothetical protein